MNPEDQDQFNNRPQQSLSPPQPTTPEVPLLEKSKPTVQALIPALPSPPVVGDITLKKVFKKKSVTIGITVVTLAMVVAIAAVLIVFLNSNETDRRSSRKTSSISSVSLSDVKSIDDAIDFVKLKSKYSSPIMDSLIITNSGNKKIYQISVIDIDGYNTNPVSDSIYRIPRISMRFSKKSDVLINDTYSNVHISHKDYIGYRDSKTIEEIFAKAKNGLSATSTSQLGGTYVFIYDDDLDYDLDKWSLYWAKPGQNEESNKNKLQVNIIQLSSSDLDVDFTDSGLLNFDNYDGRYFTIQ